MFPPPRELPAGRHLRAKIFKDRRMYVRYVTGIIGDRATAEISGGSYHPVTRELLLVKERTLEATLLVLFHEGLHQYFDTFMPTPPTWFSEGVADYFGAARLEGNRMIPGAVHPTRVDALRKVVSASKPPDLGRLIRASHPEFMNVSQRNLPLRQQTVGRNYAVSWALVHYLINVDEGEILRKYYDALVRGMTPAQAFDAAFTGVDLTALSKAVVAYSRKHLLR
jgi:hypothetical protein